MKTNTHGTQTREGKTKARKTFDGEVEVCCHRVSFWYDIGKHKLSEDDKATLSDEAEERSKYLITRGCHSGDLCCSVVRGQNETEFFGAWTIATA